MKGLLASLAMLVLLAASMDAHAEGRCPDGYYPTGGADVGWYGCAPMGGPTQGGDQGPVQQSEEPGWESRWGAIATADGAFGVANDMTSKRRAEKQAMSECKARSKGKPCKLKPAFYDQCAALAWGDGMNIVFRSPDLQDAEDSAVQVCSQHTNNCKIYYSACSYPKRVQ